MHVLIAYAAEAMSCGQGYPVRHTCMASIATLSLVSSSMAVSRYCLCPFGTLSLSFCICLSLSVCLFLPPLSLSHTHFSSLYEGTNIVNMNFTQGHTVPPLVPSERQGYTFFANNTVSKETVILLSTSRYYPLHFFCLPVYSFPTLLLSLFTVFFVCLSQSLHLSLSLCLSFSPSSLSCSHIPPPYTMQYEFHTGPFNTTTCTFRETWLYIILCQ